MNKGGTIKGTSNSNFASSRFAACLLTPFRRNSSVLEKADRLHINYMPRSNFLLVPCLAWKLEFLEAPYRQVIADILRAQLQWNF